jgi:YfiH family protein
VYAFRTSLGPVDLAFTDRLGGVSAAPFDSLDLALVGDDDPGLRAENLRLVLADFAPDGVLADLHQVHGAQVADADPDTGRVTGPDTEPDTEPGTDPDTGRPRCDGVVTNRRGVVLMVRAADCVPVLLADSDAAVVGAAHAGRQGLAVGIVPATVARMRQRGARQITGWIGPHVCGACYEVPSPLRDEVGARVPQAVGTTSWGTPSLDLGAGIRAQLEADDVTVVDAARCTRESPDLYSFRRDGAAAGRQAGLIWVRP